MARIRTIKPEFWTDETLSECSVSARLLFIGTWNFADDAGNIEGSPKQLKMKIFPADSFDIEPLIKELVQHGLLIEYEANEKKYLHIRGFTKHQRINRPSDPFNPPYQIHGGLTEDSPPEGKGRERKGKEGKGKEGIPEKIKFAENVSMTQVDRDRLVAKYGEVLTQKFIEKLDNAKGAKGYTYKSDYRAILTWVVDDVTAKSGKASTQQVSTGMTASKGAASILNRIDKMRGEESDV